MIVDAQERAIDAGGIEILSDALKKYSEDVNLCTNGSGALLHMIANNCKN